MKIEKVDKKPPARICIFGEPGSGKSTFASKAKDAIFICTEMGVGGLKGLEYIDMIGEKGSWEEILETVAELGKNDHKYKTLVFDTIDEVGHMCCQYICKKDYGGKWEAEKGKGEAFLSFHKGYEVSAIEFKRLLMYLDRLRELKGMQIIFLSHVETHTVRNAVAEDYGLFAGGLHKKIWSQVSKWADIVGFAQKVQRIYGSKDGKGGKETVEKKRILTFLGSGMSTKTRAGYEMPDEMDFDYKLFAKQLYK